MISEKLTHSVVGFLTFCFDCRFFFLLLTAETVNDHSNLSRVMRKLDFCICKNKDADKLRGNREADRRLCFRYIDSTIPLLSKSKISSF